MRTFYAALLRCEAVLAAAFLLLMVVLIFVGGIARLLHYPLNWTIDLATCFFAWAAFLCADIAWRRDSLMSIDFVTARLPQRMQRGVGYLNYAIIVVFLAYGIVTGVELAIVSAERSFQGIPGVSYSWVTMSLPVGFALLLATTLLKVRDRLHADGLLPGRHEEAGR